MKVYVVGAIAERESQREVSDSSNQTQYEPIYETSEAFNKTLEEFSGACQAIGAALVRAGHSVIVDVADWGRLKNQTIVAQHVVEGIINASSIKRNVELIIYLPPETGSKLSEVAAVANELEKLLANEKLSKKVEVKREPYDGAKDFFRNATIADAFLLIGGGSGTGLTGQSAAFLTKPIITLTAFGGAAEQSYHLILSSIYRDLGLTGEMVALTKRWDGDKSSHGGIADDVVEFAEALQLKLMRRKTPGEKQQINLMNWAIAVFVLWVFFFAILVTMNRAPNTLAQNPLSGIANFFSGVFNTPSDNGNGVLSQVIMWFTPGLYVLLLVCASFLGSTLRLLSRSDLRTAPAYTYFYVRKEVFLAILVAFGLMLLYMIGGISFTGANMVALVESPNGAIGTALSTIGFAAGFILPIVRLREQLNNAMTTSSTSLPPNAQ